MPFLQQQELLSLEKFCVKTCIYITYSDIPFLEISHSKTDGNTSPSFQRDLESLRNCLDALFQSKIIEARKYIPMVTQALKQWSLAHSLVPELVRRVMQVNSVVLSSDQFDILVKIINSALTDATSAMTLLPVSTIMYRVSEVPGRLGFQLYWGFPINALTYIG